mmetsp:Transcript_40652/g.118565  ORF Transcript_40652/g.118565 Transcript_40652/m.118565 type:complete len:203 (+) Transcript_40652:18-626(+)
MLERSALHSRRKEFHESKFKNTKEKSANRWPVFDAGLMDAGRPSSHSSARRVARTLSAPSRARAARRAHDLGVGDRVAVDAEGFAHLGQLEQVHAREQLRVGDHLWVDDGRQVEVAVVREDGDLHHEGGGAHTVGRKPHARHRPPHMPHTHRALRRTPYGYQTSDTRRATSDTRALCAAVRRPRPAPPRAPHACGLMVGSMT